MLPLRRWRTKAASVVATCLVVMETATAQPPTDNSSIIKHVPDDDDILIQRTVDIPPLLRDALKRSSGCEPVDRILRELPIITFQPARDFHPTLVPCESHVAYSVAFLFERGLTNMPSLMKFPTAAPTLLIWNAKTKELIGCRFTDLILTPTYVYRHIYRHLGGTELNGFALVGSERGEFSASGGKNWQAIWEAQPGDAPPR